MKMKNKINVNIQKQCLIHISGTPGSGKTYLYDQLRKFIKTDKNKKNKNKNKNKNKIKIVDTDDWRDEFYSTAKYKKNKTSYLKFISNHVQKLKKYHIVILCGILDDYLGGKTVFPRFDTKYKYFIKIPVEQLYMQQNIRAINHLCKNKKKYIAKLKQHREPIFKKIDEIKKEYANDEMLYVKKNKYKLANQKQILSIVKKKTIKRC
jgi:tRNA uridine 5-carbamoylmethylation protein Kti12